MTSSVRRSPEQGGARLLSELLDVLGRLDTESISRGAELTTEAIASGGVAHLFGTGHSTLACQDAWPRIGGYLGWHPIIELALSQFASMDGENGLLQSVFLEKVEGYGDTILEAHRPSSPDVMIIISHSGINQVVIDVALGCQQRGVGTVGITSLTHGSSTASRHSSGKRLFEVVDVAIDTGLSSQDAVVEVPGWDHPVGALSTITSATIVQSLISETAWRLSERGIKLPQIKSHNRLGEDARGTHLSMEVAVAEHARLLSKRVLERDEKPLSEDQA